VVVLVLFDLGSSPDFGDPATRVTPTATAADLTAAQEEAAGRFFRFYTRPEVTVYMPYEPRGLGYGVTMFRQVQDVIGLGGFGTFDLG
jgi:hypothetical protein